eukprot:1340202-Rhodomonas_salina.2
MSAHGFTSYSAPIEKVTCTLPTPSPSRQKADLELSRPPKADHGCQRSDFLRPDSFNSDLSPT